MKILVFCIPFRNVYYKALGDAELIHGTFDKIIDVTEAVYPLRTETHDPELEDRFIKLTNIEDFESVIKDSKPSLVVIFRPREIDTMSRLYDVVEKHSKQWGLIENKAMLRSPWRLFNPKNIIAYLYFRHLRGFVKSDRYKADFLFTNSKIFNVALFKYISFKKVFPIKHMDSTQFEKQNTQERIGVFIEQNMPYVVEGKVLFNLEVDPDAYYDTLQDYLHEAKKKYNLERVVISMHPTSDERAMSHLDQFETSKGNTDELIASASLVITHNSNATAYAIQHKKSIVLVQFPDVVPDIMFDRIKMRRTFINAPIDSYKTGEPIKRIYNPSLLRFFYPKLHQLYYCNWAPRFTDYLPELMPENIID